MATRLALPVALSLALASAGDARSFRVTLLGATHVITCGDRVLGEEGLPRSCGIAFAFP